MTKARFCAAPDCNRQIVEGNWCHVHQQPKKQQPKKAAPQALWNDLKQGFGVEDIALRRKCTVEDVRAYVAKLRADGGLRVLYGRGR